MNIKKIFTKKENRPSIAPKNKEERSQLLLREYDGAFRFFREHPSISIKEVFGVPPEKYRVVYRVDGLVQKGQSIESKSEHIVELFLPSDFPDEPPIATMPSPAYHPNISAERIDIRELWRQSPTLSDCIVGIGEMIVFQRYSIEQPLNGEAAQWALRNKSLLPLSSVDLRYRQIDAAQGHAADSVAPSPDQPMEIIIDDAKTKAIAIGEDTARIVLEGEPVPRRAERTRTPLTEADAEMAAAGAKTEAVSVETETVEILIENTAGSNVKVEPEKKPDGKRARRDAPPALPAPLSGVKDRRDEPAQPLSLQPDTPLKIDDRITAPALPLAKAAYCINCGSRNDGKANFCNRCGTRLSTKSSRRMTKLFFIMSMIAVPIVIIESGAIMVFMKKGPELKAMIKMLRPVAPSPQVQSTVNEAQPVPVAKKDSSATPAAAPSSAEKPVASAAILLTKDKESVFGNKPAKKKQKAVKETEMSDEDAAVLFSQPHPQSGNKQLSNVGVDDNLKLARLYMGIGSYDDAITRFKNVLAADPSNKEASAGLEKAKKMKVR